MPPADCSWFQMVRDFGFPALVAFFVLWRLDSRMKDLVDEERRGHDALVDRLTTLLDRRAQAREPPSP